MPGSLHCWCVVADSTFNPPAGVPRTLRRAVEWCLFAWVHESMATVRTPLNTILNALVSYFAERPCVKAAWSFGSHREGWSHIESDLDVGVLLGREGYLDERARFGARVAMTADIIAKLHGNDVDLVVPNDAPSRFARHAALDGRRLHCSNSEAEHAFRQDVRLRAADFGPCPDRMRGIRLTVLSR